MTAVPVELEKKAKGLMMKKKKGRSKIEQKWRLEQGKRGPGDAHLNAELRRRTLRPERNASSNWVGEGGGE